MDVLNYFLYFVILCLSVLSSPLYADNTCVQKTACSCEFSNGTGIDLSDSAKSSFVTTQMYEVVDNGKQYKLSTYYYHPCFDVLPAINATTPGSTCGVPLTLCRHTNAMFLTNSTTMSYNFTEGLYEFMATSNLTTFSVDGKSITYFNGPSHSTVLLVCADTEDKLQVQSTMEPNALVFAFYSRNACPRQLEAVGRSTGSTLLIVFFSCVIFYLVLGVCTKKFLMGATGVEVVPNLAFWSDLPNLVKDGWAFSLNGFKLPARGAGPATSPDPNSYDSI